MPPRSRPNLTDIAESIGPHQSDSADHAGIVAALQATPEQTKTPTVNAPLNLISPHPDNARSALGDVTEMAESMKTFGVLAPLTVVSSGNYLAAHPGHRKKLSVGADWVIIAGHRRHAAATLADLTEVPILVRDDLAGDETAVAAMLIENIHREGLSPLDEASALKRLADGGMKQRAISTRTGISQGQVSKRLSLLRLPAAAKTAIVANALNIQDATRLLDLPPDRAEIAFTKHTSTGQSIEICVRDQLNTLQCESDLAAARGRLKHEKLREIDPETEFGSQRWQHLLTHPEDIDAARKDKSLVASIDPHRGRFTYWTTHPKPWPWTETRDSEPDEPVESTDDHHIITEPGVRSRPQDHTAELERLAQVEQRKTAMGSRITAIKTFLAQEVTPENAVEVLSIFALASAWNVSANRVIDLAGESDTWSNFDEWVNAVSHRSNPDQTRAALAIAITGLDEIFTELAAEPFAIAAYTPALQDYCAAGI